MREIFGEIIFSFNFVINLFQFSDLSSVKNYFPCALLTSSQKISSGCWIFNSHSKSTVLLFRTGQNKLCQVRVFRFGMFNERVFQVEVFRFRTFLNSGALLFLEPQIVTCWITSYRIVNHSIVLFFFKSLINPGHRWIIKEFQYNFFWPLITLPCKI